MLFEQFKKEIIQLRGVFDVCKILLDYINQNFQARRSGVYIWNQEEGAFLLWPAGASPVDRLMIIDPLVVFLTDHDRILTLEMLQKKNTSAIARIATRGQEFFQKSSCNAMLPLVLNQSLVGLLFFDGQMEHHKDEELMEMRDLATMALSNSILYARLEGILQNLEEKVKERTRELENAQSQLVQSEKMAMLGVMVAGIAHEINTPAAVINGSVENAEKNLAYVLLHLRQAAQEIPDELQRCFFRLCNRIAMSLNSLQTQVVKNTFKKKKLLLQSLEQEKWPDARNLSSFLVESGLFDQGLELEAEEALPRFLQGSLLRDLSRLKASLDEAGLLFVYRYLMEIAGCARSLQNIKNSIRSVVRIVRALKHYSHLDQGGMASVDIRDSLENTIIIMNSVMKGEVEIERKFADIAPVVCNPDELGQVWTNLITNAYHALKGRSDAKITISTEQISESEVAIRIADNGPGIPEAIQSKIWDPFFTTKDQGEGTGLGLGIVRGIVEKHRGRIELDSEAGKGTTFSVIFSMKQSEELEHSTTRGNVHR